MKEQFIEAHEELIQRYLEQHPEATDAEAYEATADDAFDHMRERMAGRADLIRMKMKEQGTW